MKNGTVHPSESELFLQYRDDGDISALEALLHAYHRPLLNYLMRMLNTRQDAEDALQEVWLRVIRQKHTYQDQGKFSSWLFRIAHNYCLDTYRKSSNKHEVEESSHAGNETSMLDSIAAGSASPFEALSEREMLERLDQAVNQLPELIREVYVLRAVHEIPFKEIAEIQQSPLGTVLSRMHQAVRNLQRQLAKADTALSEETA